jgi:hypothetical protein
LAAHLGGGDVVSEVFLGHHVDPVGGALYSRPEITDELVDAGFTLERAEERAHLAHEHPSRRIYLLARRSA